MHVSKQISTCVDNFKKIDRAFRILGLNDYEKIYLRTYLFLFSRKLKGVCSNKPITNNLIFYSHHELKGEK